MGFLARCAKMVLRALGILVLLYLAVELIFVHAVSLVLLPILLVWAVVAGLFHLITQHMK